LNAPSRSGRLRAVKSELVNEGRETPGLPVHSFTTHPFTLYF